MKLETMHVPPRDLALYVMDLLDAPRKARVEAHVMACGACAEGLAREAQLEMALGEVADRYGRGAVVARIAHAEGSRARLQHRAMGGVAGALAAAAAIVLALASSSAHADASGVASRGAALDAAQQMVSAGIVESALEPSDKLDGG